jgi:hypothetical protein
LVGITTQAGKDMFQMQIDPLRNSDVLIASLSDAEVFAA